MFITANNNNTMWHILEIHKNLFYKNNKTHSLFNTQEGNSQLIFQFRFLNFDIDSQHIYL